MLYEAKFNLGEIVRRIKARSSKMSGRTLWQPNYYEHIIRNEKKLEKIRSYIAGHPEKHGFNENEIKELIEGKTVNADI
jgi:REP element-mobilizing transposase RayT